VHAEPSHWLHETFVSKTIWPGLMAGSETVAQSLPKCQAFGALPLLRSCCCNCAGLDHFGIYCSVFNACRDFRDTLVALTWWLFFLISLFSERDVVFFFCNFVINVATVTIIHEKILWKGTIISSVQSTVDLFHHFMLASHTMKYINQAFSINFPSLIGLLEND
jgi:hypothetical protein